MDDKAQAIVNRSYEDFQPSSNWVREEGQDTLVVTLPGFKKDQLRVQVDSQGNLKISGERLLGGNRWSRFEKGFHIPGKFRMNAVHAKLVGGLLHVIIPKNTTEPTLKDPANPAAQSPAKKNIESKTKPENNREEANSSGKEAPQPQPQMENQKASYLVAGDGKKDNNYKDSSVNEKFARSTETNSVGRMVEADLPENNIPASGKRRQAGGFEFSVGGLGSRLKKRRRVVVNVAVAIVVVALGIYATYKLRSGEESMEN